MQADKLLKELAELKQYHQMGLEKAEKIEQMIRQVSEPVTGHPIAIQAVARRNKRIKITPASR
jgi:hypothetical protein